MIGFGAHLEQIQGQWTLHRLTKNGGAQRAVACAEVFARWTASSRSGATVLPRQTEHTSAPTWSCKTCLALMLNLLAEPRPMDTTQEHKDWRGTVRGGARRAGQNRPAGSPPNRTHAG